MYQHLIRGNLIYAGVIPVFFAQHNQDVIKDDWGPRHYHSPLFPLLSSLQSFRMGSNSQFMKDRVGSGIVCPLPFIQLYNGHIAPLLGPLAKGSWQIRWHGASPLHCSVIYQASLKRCDAWPGVRLRLALLWRAPSQYGSCSTSSRPSDVETGPILSHFKSRVGCSWSGWWAACDVDLVTLVLSFSPARSVSQVELWNRGLLRRPHVSYRGVLRRFCVLDIRSSALIRGLLRQLKKCRVVPCVLMLVMCMICLYFI